MKAITTKFHGPTNSKGSRYSAIDSDNNRVTISTDYALNSDENHRRAAVALCTKMAWNGAEGLIGGGTKDGMVFVFGPSYAACERASKRILDSIDMQSQEYLVDPEDWADLVAEEIGIKCPAERQAEAA